MKGLVLGLVLGMSGIIQGEYQDGNFKLSTGPYSPTGPYPASDPYPATDPYPSSDPYPAADPYPPANYQNSNAGGYSLMTGGATPGNQGVGGFSGGVGGGFVGGVGGVGGGFGGGVTGPGFSAPIGTGLINPGFGATGGGFGVGYGAPFSWPPYYGPARGPFRGPIGISPICATLEKIRIGLQRLAQPIIVIGVTLFVLWLGKTLLLPHIGLLLSGFKSKAMREDGVTLMDELTDRILEAVDSGVCLQELACNLGRKAEGSTYITTFLKFFSPNSTEDQTLVNIFRNAAVGKEKDCRRFTCNPKIGN